MIADDCVLQIVHASDVETHTGRDAVLEALLTLSGQSHEVGHLEAAITHGKAAAAWGYWQAEADGDDLRHFSHRCGSPRTKLKTSGRSGSFKSEPEQGPLDLSRGPQSQGLSRLWRRCERRRSRSSRREI